VHWGRFGAAGLLAFHTDQAGERHVLLQQRAWWGSGGGTWGLFGGARHSHEDPVAAALRETAEECTLDVTRVRVHGFSLDDHGGWDFTTAIGSVDTLQDVRPGSAETRAAAWVPVDEVSKMRLFAPFGASWPRLRAALTRPVVVVDVANVMGSRPDGWWRDRLGAAGRLRDELAPLAVRGVRELPYGMFRYDRCFPELVLVAEGAARGLTPVEGVRVVAAPGSGDDAIVDVVSGAGPDTTHLVVTADRGLRDRCQAAGASVTGPRWLFDQLS
jgi:8-oxo-dGTP pyrophosphatase MutT (NUDIX family)